MRVADRRKQFAMFGVPRWVANDIIQKAVPCSLSKTGWHYVTVGVTRQDQNTPEGLRQRRSLVTFVRDECEHRPASEVETVLRLGGVCCRQARQMVYRAYMKCEAAHEAPEKLFELPYRYRETRAKERSDRTTPYRYMPELPEVRWSRLLTKKARRAAGDGFNGISIDWAPKVPERPLVGWWDEVGGCEMLLRYGNRRIAVRVNGVWKFSDTAILTALEDASSGHAHCWKYGGREKDDVCLACGKAVKFTEPHIRKSRHGKAVLEGLRRAMFALKKPRRPIILDI